MIAVASPLCDGNITHVLQAIEEGKDTVFIKPTLTSATPTEGEKMEFKIDRAKYLADKRTYNNNKTKLAQSLISQCALPVVDQLRGIKGHSTGQDDVLWVLSALSQMCSGIRND